MRNKRLIIIFIIFLSIVAIFLVGINYMEFIFGKDFKNLSEQIISSIGGNLGKIVALMGIIISIFLYQFKKNKVLLSLYLLLSLGIGGYIGISTVFFDAKPAIYLYPTKTTDISVKLNIKGIVLKVIPEYNDGWKVRVKPNGQMKVIGGNSQITYDYLFYENTVTEVIVPKEGWVVINNKEEITKFYNNILYKIGFNENEANEFIDYWVPRLTNNIDTKFILVKQFSREYLDYEMEIIIEPKPDSMLRVEFLYKGIDNKIEIEEPKIEEFKREGYFSVEWGGIIK